MPLASIVSFAVALLALYIHPPRGYETLFADTLVGFIGLAIVFWGIPILVAIKRLPPPPQRRA